MIIPDSVLSSIPKKASDNIYIFSANDMYTRLRDILNKKVDFIPQDMSMLANAAELYYKGFIVASGIAVDDEVLHKSHSLNTLVSVIEQNVCNLTTSRDKETLRDRRVFLNDLTDLYYSTRYRFSQPSFDDFKKCMEWLTKQRDFIIETLDPQFDKEKYDTKEEQCQKILLTCILIVL